jgi:hypothetical protein
VGPELEIEDPDVKGGTIRCRLANGSAAVLKVTVTDETVSDGPKPGSMSVTVTWVEPAWLGVLNTVTPTSRPMTRARNSELLRIKMPHNVRN